MVDGRLYPRLRAGVHVDVAQGPCRVTLGDEDLRFKGVPDRLLTHIVARFDGSRSLDDLGADFGKAAPVLMLIASQMRTRRMLLLAPTSRAAWEADSALLATSSRAYIADRASDPAAAAARWRCHPIVVSGHGRSFVLALSGLISTGAGSLAIGAERASDRAEIEKQLTVAGERCRHRWITPGEVADPATLIIRVVDGDVFQEEGSWNAVARDCASPRILAGVVRGVGVVAIARAGAAAVQPLLAPPPAGASSLVTDYARAVIGGLVAFQALNVTIADEDAERYRLLPLSDVVLVRADGGLYAADTGAPQRHADATARAPDDAVRSPFQIEREQWTAIARPFLAMPSPLLAWADDVTLPTFPLPHRALRVLPGHDARDHLVTPWAVTPSEITARTIRAGLESLANRLTGVSGHAAERSAADWAARAYLAWAESRVSSIPDTPTTRRLHYEDHADIGFRTLVRLISLYMGEPPLIAIATDALSGAPRADVTVDGFHRFALGSSVLQAATEALGRTLSAFQLRQPRSLPAPLGSQVAATYACNLDLRQEVTFQPERLGLVPHLLGRLAGLPTGNVVLGRFQSAEAID